MDSEVTRAAALALLVACAPEPRPPVPDALGPAAALAPRVDLLAARHMADAELHAQATAYVISKAQKRNARRRQ
jgi:hypothetical protein